MHSIERYNFFLLSSLEFPQYAVELVAFPADESISFSVEGESDVDITGIICSVVEDEEEEEEGEEEEGGEEEEEGRSYNLKLDMAHVDLVQPFLPLARWW